MPIKGASLLLSGTCSVSGGTSKTFAEVGETIKNGVKVSDFSNADARLRPTITCINRPAQLSKGVYISKDKRTMKFVFPKLRADGTMSFPLREVRIEDDAENTDAEKASMNSYVAQAMFDADFQSFILTGATS